MKINVKKIIFIFITAGTLSGSYFIQKIHKFESIQNCNQFAEQLEIMKHEVWEELTKIGIAKDTAVQLKKENYQQYLKHAAPKKELPISEEATQSLIIPILKEF